MGTITSGIGLISGLNTSQIIDSLMSIESQPITLIQTKINSAASQKKAYTDLSSQLQSIQTIGMTLQRPTTFLASTATSSDPTTLTATAGPGAPQGSYQFQVAQLVSAQQTISNGFTSSSALLQPGTISFEMGGGNLNPQTNLSALNGSAGVGRGQFRITDRTGKSDVIDTTSAVTLDDVVSKINTSLDISVHASIQGDKLVLTDSSNGSGTLSVQDMGGGTSAKDLGIAGNAAASTLTGSSINYLASGTALTALNDGRGVRTGTNGDLSINLSNGSTVSVGLATAQTVGDVIKAINTLGAGKVKASIAPGAKGITLTDLTGGGGSFTVTDASGSHAVEDLGLAQTGAGGVINGSPVLAGLDSVLVSSLKGGAGMVLGQISITDRTNRSATINLSGAKSFQDILDTINASGIGVSASLNAAGNGVQIQDTTGGNGNLVIAEANGGNTAQNLGIAGTFDTTQTAVNGGDLHLQYVTANTLLSSYNGGKGVTTGRFKITTAHGSSATVDLSQGTFNTIGDVINAINGTHLGVTASINANGNGILLTDNTGGAGHLSVQNLGGTTATDLNIAGTATGNTIDGAMEKSVTVTATDTLQTLQTKIQGLNFGVAASIINDGSGQSPYRLSLTALNSGKAGRMIIDSGTTGLQMRNLVQAQDAAVFVGGSGSAQPLLVTSNKNQLTGVIPGVTLNLLSANTKPVTLSITRDSTSVSTQLQSLTDTFNKLVDSLNTYTKWDTTTNQGGLLLGDPTAQTVQQQMYTIFNSSVKDAGSVRTLGDVGLTLDNNAKIQFDANKFVAAYAANPDAVQKLFTETTTGLATILNNSMTQLVDPVSGIITLENKTLDTQTTDFQAQITQLDSLLADKRTRLQNQFANMETVLAGLQSQQQALGSLSTLTTTSSSSSSTKKTN